MPAASKLIQLYVAVYGKEPSSHTTEALLRMEEMFDVTQDDALGRMMVLQLNVADRFEEVLSNDRQEIKALSSGLQKLKPAIDALNKEIDKARVSVRRVAEKTERQLSNEQIISVYQITSPLFAYLKTGFHRKTGVLEDIERIEAARRDIIGIVILLGAAIIVIILMCFYYIQRL